MDRFPTQRNARVHNNWKEIEYENFEKFREYKFIKTQNYIDSNKFSFYLFKLK